MFEKFTKSALNVVMSAQAEARTLNQNFVGTELILLGLLSENVLSAQILNAQNLNIKDTRNEVQKVIGNGSGSDIEIPFTPNVRKLLQNAWTIANKYNHPITELHLLLALISTDGKHLEILKTFNADIDKIKMCTEEEIQKLEIKFDFKFCFYSLMLIAALLYFSFALLGDLISSLIITRSSMVAMIELILITFLVRINIPFYFKAGCPLNLFKLIRILCLVIGILFIAVLILVSIIWIMVTIGKYKYSM